jgi:hypothetical protein
MPRAYVPKVEEYFWRPVRPMGSAIQGSAGSMQSGTEIVFAADVRAGLLCKLGFRAFACPHIIAACHHLAEQLEGSPVEALLEVRFDSLRAEFDIPVEKAGKLLILQDALRACYADYQARKAASGL